jgi:hypothetical protein
MKLHATAGGLSIADGTYEATLLSITLQEPKPEVGTGQPYLRWTFCVYDPDEHPDGAEMIANSSLMFGPKAKARRWAQTILGRMLEPGEELDTDELCPAVCQVIVKKDLESGYCRIDDVLGPRKAKAKPPAPAGKGKEMGIDI